MIMCREFYLQHFRRYYYAAVTPAAAAVVVLTLTHRFNAVRGLRTGPKSYSSVQHARNIMLFSEQNKRSRCVDQICYPYVRLKLRPFGEESACATGRWAFGCSDTVMVNM